MTAAHAHFRRRAARPISRQPGASLQHSVRAAAPARIRGARRRAGATGQARAAEWRRRDVPRRVHRGRRRRGSLIFMAAIVLLGVALVVRDLRRPARSPPSRRLRRHARRVDRALAGVFGIVIGVTTAKLLGSLHSLSIGPHRSQTSWPTRLMLSLGAGLYEELFFRVLLVTGIAAGARIVLGLGRAASGIIAAVVGAFIFSAFHYIGPYGDQLELQSFVFRMLSGLAFSGALSAARLRHHGVDPRAVRRVPAARVALVS